MRWVVYANLFMVSAIHLCSTCKFFKKDYFRSKYDTCTMFPNRILIGHHMCCSTARKLEELCGPNGTLYKKGVS